MFKEVLLSTAIISGFLLSFTASAQQKKTEEVNFADDYSPAFLTCQKNNVDNDPKISAICFSTELRRMDTGIEKMFTHMLKTDRISTWNNGNGVFRGSFKDMIDQWKNFRHSYCQLYSVAMKEYTDVPEYNYQTCASELTKNYFGQVKGMLANYEADLTAYAN